MSKTIICESCGAAYEDTLRRCPFCGTATPEADEKEYMDKLEENRKDLEDYEPQTLKKIGSNVSKVVIFGIIAFIVIAVITVCSVCFSGLSENRERNKKKEELLKDQGVTVGMLEVSTYEM